MKLIEKSLIFSFSTWKHCQFKNSLQMSLKRYFTRFTQVFDYCDENTLDLMVTKLADPEIIRKLILDMYGNYGNLRT